MALKPNELRELKTALSEAIKSGFEGVSNKTQTSSTDYNGKNVKDFTKDIDQDARNEYMRRKRKAQKADALFQLQLEQEEFNEQEHSKLYKKLKNKQFEQQKKNIEKGVTTNKGGGAFGMSPKGGAKANVGGIINKIGDEVLDILDKIWQLVLAGQRNAVQQAINAGNYNQAMAKASLNLTKKEFASISKTLSTYTGLASENALSLYQQSSDEAVARVQKGTEGRIASMELAAAEQKREAEYAKAKAQAIGGMTTKVGGGMMALGAGMVATGIGAPLGVAIGILGGIAAIAGKAYAKVAEWKAEHAQIDYEAQEKAKERFQEQMEISMGQFDAVKQVVEGFDNFVDGIRKYIVKNDTEYMKIGTTMGMTGQMYASYARRISGEVAKTFGITAKDMGEMSKGYESQSGRTRLLSGEDYNNIYATGKLYGIGSSQAASLYGAMNIFNVSIESGADSLGRMYKQVTKMGLSTTKFSKDLEKNLKMAEKHNFKGGVENMMKLTKWAQQARFNLDSAASFSESIMSGTISDVLEKSAKLQVLGGSAAMYSDPFGMMYEAGADVGSLAKRQAAMFNDLTGTFNKDTGETDFSWYENRMIAARAAAAGMEAEDVKNMIRQNNKQGEINKLFKYSNFDDETKLAIGNRAEFVKGKGWQVNTTEGTKGLNELSTMSPEELQRILLPKDTEEGVVEIAANVRSIEEYEKAQYEFLNAINQTGLFGSVVDFSQANMKNQEQLYNMPGFTDKAKDSLQSITEVNKKQTEATVEMFTKNSKLIDDYRKYVQNNIESSKELTETTKITMKILAKAQGGKELQDIIAKANKAYHSDDLSTRNKEMNAVYQSANADQREYLEAYYSEFKNGKFDYKNTGTNDGYGYTGGGVMVGARNVRPINDGAVNVKTAKSDQYLAAMPNGPIDKILQQLIPGLQALLKGGNSSNTGNNLSINVGGKIMLEQGNTRVNLVDIIKNNPMVANKIVSLLQRAIETTDNGKSKYNYKV